MRTLAAMGLILAASTAAAQGGTPPQGGGMGQQQARTNEMLFKDITLTEAQKAKVDTIQTKQREDQRAIMQSGGGMQDSTTRAKVMELRTKSNAAIRDLLTPEQQVIFDKNVAAMPPPGRRPPPRR